MNIVPLGDSSALVQLGDEIDLALNQRVHALSQLIEAAAPSGLLETVPAYGTLLVHYDPLTLSFEQVKHFIQSKMEHLHEHSRRPPRLIEVPTQYGGTLGPDLENAAHHLQLTTDEVVRLHSSQTYTVYMMGFMPGYPYMGKLDDALTMPRLETPRTRVPAGTVAIAGSQTGIYSVESPGGWNLIGWTPLTLFDPMSASPFLFRPGDEVKFIPEKP